MHLSYGDGEALVAKPAQETRRCRSTRCGAEGLDEQNLEQVRQDDIPRRLAWCMDRAVVLRRWVA